MRKSKQSINRFEYSPLISEYKKQSDILGKQYQGQNKVYEAVKKEGGETTNREEKDDDKKSTIEKYNKPNLVCSCNHSLCKYHNIEKYDNLP